MPRKPHVECLLCRKQAGQQAKTVERHLHDCFLRGPASEPHAALPRSGQSAREPAASAASAAPAAGGAAGWAGRAAAAGDRVLVLELTSEHLFRMTVLAAPHATFRDLRRLMLKLWLDCGCGHLCGFSRLAEPAAGPWARGGHAKTQRQSSADRLGDVLRLPGEQLRFSYDMGDSTSVNIEVKETAGSLNSVAAAWLGSRPLAAGLRNAHPGTVQRCQGCGQPGRYLGESGSWCSKACAAEGGEEPQQLARWWNSPRMGACGYCGPDGVTPESFWPAEPDFPDDDSGSEDGSWEGSQDEEGEGEEGASVVSGISWGEADRMAAEGRQQQQAGAAQAAAPPAAHAALVEPGPQLAADDAPAEQQAQQQRRKRSAPGDAHTAAEQPPLQRRREEQPAGGEAGRAGAAGVTASAGTADAAGPAADAAAALRAAFAAVRPVDIAASPNAAHRTAARDILAAPTLARLQAAAAVAAATQQQLQPLKQLVAGPQDMNAAAVHCLAQMDLVYACFEAETAWQRALSAYQDDLPLRLTSHLMAAECQRQAPPPARRGGRQAPRQRRMSAAAAPAAAAAEGVAAAGGGGESLEERHAAIERAHEELDFTLSVQRVLQGPSLTSLQRAARYGDMHAYAAAAAAAAAASQPAQPAARPDPMSELHNRGWDDSYFEAISGSGNGWLDPVAAMRWQAQRAALPVPQQVLGRTSDLLAMLAERAGWRAQVMAWYEEAPPALALWLAERERRDMQREAAAAKTR